MIFRVTVALLCCVFQVTVAGAQVKDVKVSRATRLDWEAASEGFVRGAPGEALKDYDSKKQKYQLYVPVRYTTTKNWPLVVFISAGPDPAGWFNLQRTCEREGMLFCSPYRAGNNTPPAQRIRIILDMVDDVRRNYRIDPHQTYIGGFSGGGRMACTIGFALPEVFAGVFPVCGTNPPRGYPHQRHRLVDRVSVAFVTGDGDFNRNENEQWMHPYFQDLDIRTKLWVVPGMGHDIPRGNVMEDVMAWLATDLERRKADAKARPKLNWKYDEAFRGDASADRLLAAAREELRDDQRVWRGVALAQGLKKLWPESVAAKASDELLNQILNDERRAELFVAQRIKDDEQSYGAQARGQERIGKIADAIQIWESLAKNFPDTPTAEAARAEVERLQKRKEPFKVRR